MWSFTACFVDIPHHFISSCRHTTPPPLCFQCLVVFWSHYLVSLFQSPCSICVYSKDYWKLKVIMIIMLAHKQRGASSPWSELCVCKDSPGQNRYKWKFCKFQAETSLLHHWVHLNCTLFTGSVYSETRLIQTPEGNRKTSVLTEVRGIQSKLLPTARARHTCVKACRHVFFMNSFKQKWSGRLEKRSLKNRATKGTLNVLHLLHCFSQ